MCRRFGRDMPYYLLGLNIASDIVAGIVRFVVDLLHTDESDRRVAAIVVLFTSPVRRRCVLCPWPVTIICLYYNMTDFMDKLAEFVCWTIPMLYETKTQNVGEFTYFVSKIHKSRTKILGRFQIRTRSIRGHRGSYSTLRTNRAYLPW